ncbi:OmpH family outer membrane protein [bacterium]|nr:OmpH family outer membrane protein [bacterium]
MKKFWIILLFGLIPLSMQAQRVCFINSQTIRENFIEAQQAEQRIQSFVDEWKRELATMQANINNLEFDINKNRLIWTDAERGAKEKQLQDLRTNSDNYTKSKFSPGGEYDKMVKQILLPVEQKISAAVQKVANKRNFDIVFDQSVQPLAYVNFKYDLTVDVLRELGVDVKALEEEQQEKIAKDPANQKKESVAPRRVSRTQNPRSKQQAPTDQREFEQENPPADSTETVQPIKK